MKLLIFDTETTGLPKSREPAINGPNNWPHIVSISWVVFDTETNTILRKHDYIIKPDNWTIPLESIGIHGITNEIAQAKGVPLYGVIKAFLQEPCDTIVAHNIQFDLNVILNAILWDLRLEYPILPKQLCTMVLSLNMCKLPGNFGKYKYPKLKELYFHVFQKMPDEKKLHGSLYDVLILTEIIECHLPLRKVMGLVSTSVRTVTNGVRTIHFNFDESD